MDAEQRKKLERLKAQAHIKEQRQRLQKNVLLQECLDALSFYLIIEDEDEIKHIESLVASSHAEMRSHDDKVILEDDERYYIVWDEATLPVVMSTGKNIVERVIFIIFMNNLEYINDKNYFESNRLPFRYESMMEAYSGS